jgi:hypothetical protein
MKTYFKINATVFVLVFLLILSAQAAGTPSVHPEYLRAVTDYADAIIAHAGDK